jgi:hypothetical protein
VTAPPDASLSGDELADLLMRLLLDGQFRQRLAAEGAGAVAANAGELECLATIDLDELDTTARRFRSKIWRLGCGGNLGATFPRSCQQFAAAGIDESELLTGFLGSAAFGTFRLLPYTGPGQSVEESFASFLLDFAAGQEQARFKTDGNAAAGLVLPETIAHELMIALFTALTCEQPLSFVIATGGIITTNRGHAALRPYSPASVASWRPDRSGAGAPQADSPTVNYAYFGTRAGITHGVVSDQVATAFQTVPTAAGDAARRALAERGLW